MKSFLYLTKTKTFAEIDSLKDVHEIRHYTTGDALIKILESGVLKPNQSIGDEDWKDYDIGELKVVSFLDKRFDDEMKEMEKANQYKRSIEGYTYHLGLISKKACAVIELDYDKVESMLRSKSKILNIYPQMVDEFDRGWNRLIDDLDEDIAYYTAEVTAIDKLLEDEELLNMTVKHKDRYKAGKDNLKMLIKTISKGVSDEDINRMVDHFPSDWNFDEYKKGQKDWNDISQAKNRLKDYLFIKKLHPTKFSKKELDDLKYYLTTLQYIDAIRLLKKHGWNPKVWYTYSNSFPNKGHLLSVFLGNLLDAYDNKTRGRASRSLNKLNPEIRIASEILITRDNATILVFEGIMEGTKQKSLLPKIEKYISKYNIKFVK